VKYIGIDPGLFGAITELDDHGKITDIFDMPLTPDRTAVSEKGLLKIFQRYTSEDIAALEESHAMKFFDKEGKERQQSISSMLSYGKHWGLINGLLLASGMKYFKVVPKTWQSVFGVKGKQRGFNSADIAAKLYPDSPLPYIVESSRSKSGVKIFDGRSDSTMIARWCFMQN
jgi:hypothetical protein